MVELRKLFLEIEPTAFICQCLGNTLLSTVELRSYIKDEIVLYIQQLIRNSKMIWRKYSFKTTSNNQLSNILFVFIFYQIS